MKLVRDIIDPAIVPVVSIPKTIDDLAVYISKNYVPCFDNIDTISNQVSDLLCIAVTGGDTQRESCIQMMKSKLCSSKDS